MSRFATSFPCFANVLLAVACCACSASSPPRDATASPAIRGPADQVRERADRAWSEQGGRGAGIPMASAAASASVTAAAALAASPVGTVQTGAVPAMVSDAGAALLAVDSSVEACRPEAHGWVAAPPRNEDDSIHGVGRGATLEEALERARTEAAKSVEVTISSTVEDTQVDWQRTTDANTRADYESKVKAVSQSKVSRKLADCRQMAACREAPARVVALVTCARRASLERDIEQAAKRVVRAVPAKSALLFVPGTDERGLITGFGEYAVGILRAYLSALIPAEASLLKPPTWTPTALRDLARQWGATHFVRLEHIDAGRNRLRVSVWLQDARTDKISSPVSSFEVGLDADQLSLLAVRGPLLPQKAAMDLASDMGDRRVELSLSRQTLYEGDPIEITTQVREPSYLYLFDLYEDGTVSMLIPSSDSPNNLARPGKPVRIPDENWRKNGTALTACPIRGHERTKETVKVVASATPLGLEDAFRKTSGGAEGASAPEATAAELLAKLNELRRAGVSFADASVSYEVRARPSPKSPCR